MAYSFYGGKPGVSYRIVEHFDSIYDMVLNFQQGGSYNKVNYGEYVIIDTIVNNNQKNNPENGIIYRRGLDYTEVFNPNDLDYINENHTVAREDLENSEEENPSRRYYSVSLDIDNNEIITFNSELYRSNFQAFVTNPGGGAEYIGQIVGPEGDSPELSILDWSNFIREYNGSASEEIKGSLQVSPPAGASFYDGEGEIISQGKYYTVSLNLDLEEVYQDQDENIVSGNIKDVIQYGYLNLRDADGNIFGAYIAFDIPYSVFNFHAESVDPYQDELQHEGDHEYGVYDPITKTWNYIDLISEDDISKEHPYYWQYKIKVPIGVHGQSIEEFGLERRPTDTINDGNDVNQEDNNYQYYYKLRDFDSTRGGVVSNRIYLDSWERSIFKITDNGIIPNSYATIQRNTFYSLGDKVWWNGLRNHLCLLAVNEGTTAIFAPEKLSKLALYEEDELILDGTVIWKITKDNIKIPDLLTIHYTHGDNEDIKIRLLDLLSIDKNDGRIYVKYSDLDKLVYIGDNQSILRIEYHDTYTLGANGTTTYPLNRICIVFNTYNYNANGDLIKDPYFSLNEDTGNLIYPTTDSDGHNIQYIDEQFKFLDYIERDEDTREVIAYYNDGTSTSFGVIRSIDSIFINDETNLSVNKHINVKYDNKVRDGLNNNQLIDDIQQVTGEPLNQVASIQLYGDNLIVLYSDPDARATLYNNYGGYAIPHNTYDIPGFDNTTGDDDGNGNLYWIDLGSAYYGNHIFGNFTSFNDDNDETSLVALYPYGFGKDTSGNTISEQINHTGWIATVTTQNGCELYAYDYNSAIDPLAPEDNWYKLQDMSAASFNPEWVMKVSVPDSNNANIPPQQVDSTLNTNGYWFIISTRAD